MTNNLRYSSYNDQTEISNEVLTCILCYSVAYGCIILQVFKYCPKYVNNINNCVDTMSNACSISKFIMTKECLNKMFISERNGFKL